MKDNKAGSKHLPKKYNVTEGYITEMTCEIPIKDKPIIWRRSDGQPLPSNHKISGRDLVMIIDRKYETDEIYFLLLCINNVQKEIRFFLKQIIFKNLEIF